MQQWLEREPLADHLRGTQMTVVNGVEGSAKDTERLHLGGGSPDHGRHRDRDRSSRERVRLPAL